MLHIKEYVKQQARKYTLLYAEDNLEFGRQMNEIFSMIFKKTVWVKDGLEAFQEYEKEKYDLLFFDIEMPKCNGFDLSKKILQENPDANITVLTGHDDKSYLLKALELGIDKYILKPIDEEKLFKSLEKTFVALEAKTRYARALEEKDMLSTILDLSPMFVLLIVHDELKYINKALLDYLGYDSIESLRKENDCVFDLFYSLEAGFDKKHQNISFYKKHIIENKNQDYHFSIRSKKFKNTIFKLDYKYYENSDTMLSILTDVTDIYNQNAELKSLAEIDTLTQIYNRRIFDKFSKQSLRNFALGVLDSVSILMFDIDHFKKINDTYGHAKGDEVLQKLASFIKEHIRSNDVFARWGGEEFVVIMPFVELNEATSIAERFREEIEKFFKSEVTCSFGVTTFKKNDDEKTLFARLDKALYSAKESGRNRVVAL